MKKIVWIILMMATVVTTHAQTIIISQVADTAARSLNIGYYTTTVLVFPSTILDADRGFRDILIEKQKTISNVLNIKANRKDFSPTNLHVYTADGKVYCFDVRYEEYPAKTTFHIVVDSMSVITNSLTTVPVPLQPLNESELLQTVEKARTAKPTFHRATRDQQMKLQLKTIHTKGNLLFMGLEIKNKSTLPFATDFIRLYIQDKQHVKRTSLQQREIIPAYQDQPPFIGGRNKNRYVVAIPRFTLDKQKHFLIELFESNGGRHLTLEINNQQLLRAKNW